MPKSPQAEEDKSRRKAEKPVSQPWPHAARLFVPSFIPQRRRLLFSLSQPMPLALLTSRRPFLPFSPLPLFIPGRKPSTSSPLASPCPICSELPAGSVRFSIGSQAPMLREITFLGRVG
jgi:hypothetical protein